MVLVKDELDGEGDTCELNKDSVFDYAASEASPKKAWDDARSEGSSHRGASSCATGSMQSGGKQQVPQSSSSSGRGSRAQGQSASRAHADSLGAYADAASNEQQADTQTRLTLWRQHIQTQEGLAGCLGILHRGFGDKSNN